MTSCVISSPWTPCLPHISMKLLILFVILIVSTSAKVTFEKMTNRDYPGSTYYTIRNVSLYECLGWCRDEVDCSAASFSFVVNPLAPMQETTCRLQNETTTGHKTTSSSHSSSSSSSLSSNSNPQKAVNLYYFSKTNLRSDNVCNRLWSFEKYPNKVLRGLDNAIIYTSNKEACLSSCLNEVRFVCRSVEFNYVTLQCHLSEYDRRSPGAFPVDLVDTQGVDYFENSCLQCEYFSFLSFRLSTFLGTSLFETLGLINLFLSWVFVHLIVSLIVSLLPNILLLKDTANSLSSRFYHMMTTMTLAVQGLHLPLPSIFY